MQYRPLVLNKLKEFSKEFPQYSIGELLYSMIASSGLGEDFTLSKLLKISDQDFYSMIEKSIELESEEN